MECFAQLLLPQRSNQDVLVKYAYVTRKPAVWAALPLNSFGFRVALRVALRSPSVFGLRFSTHLLALNSQGHSEQ